MFVNDVSRALELRTVAKLFADDLKSYMRIYNAGDLDVFNKALCSLQKWSSDWQRPIALAKCSVMRITNRNTEVLGNIRIGDHVLDEINELKYLGVIFKDDLSFKNHITGVITKARQRLFLLHK